MGGIVPLLVALANAVVELVKFLASKNAKKADPKPGTVPDVDPADDALKRARERTKDLN